MTVEHIINSERELKTLATNIAVNLAKNHIVTFCGTLGSGKTVFCRELIRYFCGENTTVTSPTYNLLQIYDAPNFKIYHYDLYRIKHAHEIYELDIEDALNGNLCLIEWADIISNILPQENLTDIKIEILTETSRLCTISQAPRTRQEIF